MKSSYSIMDDYVYYKGTDNEDDEERHKKLDKAIKKDGKTRVLKSLKSYYKAEKATRLHPQSIRNLHNDLLYIKPNIFTKKIKVYA